MTTLGVRAEVRLELRGRTTRVALVNGSTGIPTTGGNGTVRDPRVEVSIEETLDLCGHLRQQFPAQGDSAPAHTSQGHSPAAHPLLPVRLGPVGIQVQGPHPRHDGHLVGGHP